MEISQVSTDSSMYIPDTTQECSPEPVPDTTTSAFNDIEEKENTTQKSNKLTIEDLAKANEGAFKDVPKFMAEELEKAYSQYGIESGGYDLLCDETGLVKANKEDFETAYALEQLNANISNGSSAINKEEKHGNVYYSYDTDGDGDFETSIAFDSETGKLMQHHIDDEGVGANISREGQDFSVSSKYGVINYNSESNELQDNQGVRYNISYNSDGAVKNISVSESTKPDFLYENDCESHPEP